MRSQWTRCASGGRRGRPNWPTLLLVVAMLPLVGDAVFAHHPTPLTLDTLTRRAAVIVEGTVVAKESSWNDEGTQIHTTITLEVIECLKGEVTTDTLEVRYLGGTVGDITLAIIGQPGFVPDEQVVLFLVPSFSRRDIPFVGGHEGKFNVSTNTETQVDYLSSVSQRLQKTTAYETIDQILAPIRAASEKVQAGAEEVRP